MRLRFTKEQSDVLGKFLYDSTEVQVVVKAPRDKVAQLAIELNVTSKRIMQWIGNRKRSLKPELFRKAAFEACGIPGLTGELLTPAITKPKKSMLECPGAPKRPMRVHRINRSDAVPTLLNFKDTGLPTLEPDNTEETSLDELWQPFNGEPPAKKIKTEHLSSAASTTEQYNEPSNEKNNLVKHEGGGTGDMTNDFQSTIGDGFPMELVSAESAAGMENSAFSPGMNFDYFVKNHSPLSTVGHGESSKGLPNSVLFPSFLSGLPSNEPNTPKTPSMHPKLEIKRPFGRPPPCVGGVDEPSVLGFVQQPSFKKEPSKKLPRSKKRGNPVARSTAKKARKKLNDNQQLILESFYTANLFTTKEIKEAVAQSAGLTYKQVRIWIMNRKVRDKKGLPSLLPEMKPSTARGFSEIQRRQMIAFFNAGLLDELNYRKAIAKATGLTEKQIKVWRMNTRAKLKKEGKLICSEA